MLSNPRMSKAKSLLSTAASIAGTAMLIRTIANEFLPQEILNDFSLSFQNLSTHFSSQLTIVIEEFRGLSLNELFEAAELYLGTKAAPSTKRLKVGKSEKENKLGISMDRGDVLVDVYENVEMKWKLLSMQVNEAHFQRQNRGNNDLSVPVRAEFRQYELSFLKKNKEMVFNSYLPYILQKAKMIKEENQSINLHAVIYRNWDTNDNKLNHPMTFKTLAMDSELKRAVLEDLDNFRNGKEYYKRVGKAWKRGYLLYGPPGTGKSSLIAAMANHLNFNIYDLDLTDVQTNSDLRFLLLSMPSRSIMVIEDIDCSIKLENRVTDENDPGYSNHGNNKVTLSGVLNFIDGLWSCCGEERIIVFTTNHKERLDPALLRPGRMDMHIHLSYCNASVFKQLALNYLGVTDHYLFQEIEKLLEEVNVTPAEVARELMKTSIEEAAFQGLLKFMYQKINGSDMKKKD
ncbi:hypothetical protein CCACVL1_15931 [Corchorus capsularis]|uniref:AAA+ ATPase domain-containing protein n=1 Tax=Corchorus capsularis TaxID=210143 RepID=A0A1R3I0P7_COCAP|nr:hypothetical protein CCACVL1_15931 [Corchorus capsularis]